MHTHCWIDIAMPLVATVVPRINWWDHNRVKKNIPGVFWTPWWRHQMETFYAILALCAGNSPVTGEFPTQSQWRGALMFSFICAWLSDWVNNREAGDLRRQWPHYDVTVMSIWHCVVISVVIAVNIGSSNDGVVSEETKPLPDSMATDP